MDMIRHGYAMISLQSKLQNFSKTFMKLTDEAHYKLIRYRVHDSVVRDKYWWLVTEMELGVVLKGKTKHPGMIDW